MKESYRKMGIKSVLGKLIILCITQLCIVALYGIYLFIVLNRDIPPVKDSVLRNSALFGGVLFASLVGGTWLIVRSFKRSIRKPMSVLARLAQGDITAHAETTADEFGELTHAANQLSENLTRASFFAKAIGEGNADISFKSAGDQDLLGNSLLQMREKLSSITEADKKRNWTAEGLALFADFIRKYDDQQELSDTLIRELVRYTKCNQGGLFILNRDNEQDHYLELVACYAYERKKFLTKRVEIGQGMLGQCYLEGEPVFLTQVPPNYVSITSGLGSSNPSSVLIVPLKLNDITEGVVEIASFNKFEDFEVQFVQRVGEIIASAISNARINARTKQMLEESQQQSEEMRAQEEEMRQNMEEMQATQELMERQASEMKKIQSVLELEKSMFNVLMEFLPDRITYKDTESRILRINKAKAQRINMSPEEVIGKTDYDFFSREHAEKAMREEKALIDSGKPLLDIEEQLRFNNGDTAWVATSRIPFKNDHNQVTGMFIITKDITKLKTAELTIQDRDRIISQLLTDLPVFHYKVNRDGVIFEAWRSDQEKSILPDTKQIESRKLIDVFPEVNRCIQQRNGHRHNPSCIQAVPINGTPVSFKHHIFSDSLHDGNHWVYAIKND